MANLSITTGGLRLKNPIVLASSPLTAKLERLKRADENGAAAVSLKHSLLKQQFHARPRWYAEKGLGVIVSGDPRLEVEEAQELIRKAKEQTGLQIIVNMSALPTDLDSWGKLARRFEEAGADAVELNMNCPNLHTAQAQGPTLGANLGQDPESCAKVVANVKQHVRIPVIAKLPTEGGRLPQVAAACSAAGVDILNIHAGFRAAPGLDIYNGGVMRYPGSTAGPLGGFSGPWSRLISNRFIADIARQQGAPVMGGGGISTWEHVVESIMYGAWSVQICTAVMLEGYELVGRILKSLSAYMDNMGYQGIADFQGLALNNILGPNQMAYTDVTACVDEAKCIGCAKCTRLAACDAIRMEGKKARPDPALCVGCGLCVAVCPSGAIRYEPKA